MFTVWSPFDGQPIPAPNETERDILLAQGYLAEPPDRAGWTEPPGGFATGGLVDGPQLIDLPPGSTGDTDPDEP